MKPQFNRTLRYSLVAALGGTLFIGAYQNDDIGRASATYLDRFFATLSDDDKHDPKNAVASLRVAPGLQATLFAAEPMLKNPTNIDVDARGRVWVCEAYNYRPAINGNPTHTEGDRIVVLEDQTGDGVADVSKVFYQGPELQSPLGIWVQGNKVIVSNSPHVWVFTDDDGDDKADRKELLFTGIDGDQHDHGMHAFVFGPDGKWYFNFGNSGGQLRDKNNKPVLDKATGRAIDPSHYKQGMVFRCNPDGTEVELLGQNFRNNFEVAIDSYGTLWQSDNDDDGNKGVRINYVMEYGNYGYTDEMTGAGWNANRTNLEKTIPERHWHLNDPGVVPNLLQTGAGSPTGILVYEGSLLPGTFQNQVIHCDAGPNVVRAYPTQKSGAGYTATIAPLVEGVRDQWFRPSDVCVAPDGSLLVADWYDPGVGGHQAGDQDRGRVFRLAPTNSAWSVPKMDVSSIEGAISALQSPNMSARYLGWTALHNLGQRAEKPLKTLYQTANNPRMKARALWLLSQLPKSGKKYIDAALHDANPDLRITALRAARAQQLDVIGCVKQLVNDPDPQVRRECALALRHARANGQLAPEAPALWAQLAGQHTGTDRWYLEALGIGAEGQWDRYYAAYLQLLNNNPLANAGGRDVIWRARTAASVPLLAQLAGEKTLPLENRLRYFRAFDFNPGKVEKSNALLQLIADQNNPDVTKLALRHLDPTFVLGSPAASRALQSLLDQTYGTTEYMELVQRYEPTTENTRLRQLAVLKPSDNIGRDAARQLLKQNGLALAWETINGNEQEAAQSMLSALRYVGSGPSLAVLKAVALDTKRPMPLRREATRALGGSQNGEDMVIELLKSGQISGDLKPVAYQGVASAWRKTIRTEAASYLDNTTAGSAAATGKKLPGITELLAMNGEASRGLAVYKNNCSVCHQVNAEGQNFGPKLSEIGSKLGKDGQYLAILYPDAGISFGYEGYDVKFKDGSNMTGIVSSKTETDLQMRFPGGLVQNYKMADVVSIKKTDSSLMPSGLQEAMTTQELVDLVEYLATLKKQ